jgi:hypothetical protein
MTQSLRQLRVGHSAPLSDANAFREATAVNRPGEIRWRPNARLAEAAYPG